MTNPESNSRSKRRSWKSLGNHLYYRDDKSGRKYGHKYVDPETGKPHGPITLNSTTKTAARREITERETLLHRGEIAAPSKVTTDEMAADFFDAMDGMVASGDRSQRTRDLYEQRWRTHLKPLFGHRSVQTVTARAIAGCLSDLKKSGLAPWTCHGIQTALSSILEHAKTRGVIATNPVHKLGKNERPKQKNKRPIQVLSQDAIAMLVKATTVGWRLFILVLALTGMRVSEVLGLCWQDIDFKARKIHVRNQLGRKGKLKALKTPGSVRTIDLAPALYKTLLEAYMASDKAPDGFVFVTDSGRPRSYANAARAFNVARTGLIEEGKRLSMHSLRHTFASALISAGVDVVRISKMLGHAKVSTTLDMYADLFEARGQKSMGDAIGNALGF